MNGWHVGRKAILAFMERQFGVTSWQTVRAWKKSGMPIHYLWNGKPYIIESEVIKWQLKRRAA